MSGNTEMTVNKRKSILCFSGGLDSTVLLYLLQAEGSDVYPLSVFYNQRHKVELNAASKIIRSLNLSEKYHQAHLGETVCSLLKGSSQTDDRVDVPEGHYAEESMKATVVPNRNMILLSLATAWAISLKADTVAYAAHAGDHAIYPDCREAFVIFMRSAINRCDWNPPLLYTPFLKGSKANIVRLGYELGVPFEKTYSCYKGGEKHCGKCGTCTERIEAFKLAGVVDPTEYALQ